MNANDNFSGLGIAPGILSILTKLKFIRPTPIQARSIPVLLEGKDLAGIAQTGTGKTLAFGIPTIQRILQNKGMGLVVLPTRELAVQVRDSLRTIGDSLGVKTVVLIGGAPIGRQISDLRRKPDIVIGTPGRINDHLEQRTLNLSGVKILVLDEADRMLDMGFAPQLRKIIKFISGDRQTILFSATMPHEIMKLAKDFMKLPIRIEVAPSGTAATNVTHEVFMLNRDKKPAMLAKLLYDYKGSVLIFTRTKFAARKVAKYVRDCGHTASEFHSNRSLNQRRDALEGFKNGRYRVLAATDIAARGIDVTGIELVINYDLPEQAEDYVHRIGRTGRAGAAGHAISFATPDQGRDLKTIERLIKKTLKLSELPGTLPTIGAKFHMELKNKPRGFRRYDGRSGKFKSSSSGSRGGNKQFSKGGRRGNF